MDREVVADVVAAVAQRGGVEGEQPDAVHPQPVEVVEALGQPPEVTAAVAARVGEAPQEDLVEHRPPVPLGIVEARSCHRRAILPSPGRPVRLLRTGHRSVARIVTLSGNGGGLGANPPAAPTEQREGLHVGRRHPPQHRVCDGRRRHGLPAPRRAGEQGGVGGAGLARPAGARSDPARRPPWRRRLRPSGPRRPRRCAAQRRTPAPAGSGSARTSPRSSSCSGPRAWTVCTPWSRSRRAASRPPPPGDRSRRRRDGCRRARPRHRRQPAAGAPRLRRLALGAQPGWPGAGDARRHPPLPRRVGGLVGPGRRGRRSVRARRHPARARDPLGRRRRRLLRRLRQRHALAALPRRHPHLDASSRRGGRPTSASTSASPRRRPAPRRPAPSSGCTTTTCSSCPRCSASCGPTSRIGFFLHIPFPPQELFMRLPWREEVLRGLLGSDLVGFQRRVAAENFVAAAPPAARRRRRRARA